MATRRWLGAAAPVTQITTITIGGTIASGETFTATIGSSAVTITTETGDTTSTVASKLATAMGLRTSPAEFSDANYLANAAVVTCTGRTAGKPFAITGSEASTSGTITVATPTAATGPNDFQNAKNWSGGVVPVSTDTVVFQDSDVGCWYGLANSGVTLASLIVEQSFTGTIGLPDTSDAGYAEYRTKYLTVKATQVLVGRGTGRGSDSIRIDLGSHASAVSIFATAPTRDRAAVQLLAVNVGSSAAITSGSLSVAVAAEESSTLGSIVVGRNAAVVLGRGVTVLAAVNEGNLTSYADLPSLSQKAGNAVVNDATVTSLDQTGGAVAYRSAGTITDATVGPGTLSLDGDSRGRTIDNLTLRPGGKFVDTAKTATLTNGIVFSNDVGEVQAT